MEQGKCKALVVRKYPFVKYKDWTFIPWPCIQEDPEKRFNSVKQFTTRKNDVLFCSPMKCGTHWVHEILHMLTQQTTEYSTEVMLHLDYIEDINGIGDQLFPRILHTHLPYSFLPTEHISNGRKIVCLNRNPKDRHVSAYHHYKGTIGFPNWSWDEYFNEMILKDTMHTGWFNYTKEWIKAMENGATNIYPLLYEDLLLNTEQQIMHLAEFLDIPHNADFIKEIADKCSFHKLKDNKFEDSGDCRIDGKSALFRKGIIGDWKNWFTVAQNEKFDELYQKEMKGVNIKFTYE